MKRTILRYAALLALLWAGLTPGQASGRPETGDWGLPEIAADSLHRLCGGRLPLYTAGKELWLEFPETPLRLTVQVDRGAGMRSHPVQSLTTFRLTADPEANIVHVQPADTLPKPTSALSPLPLARVEGTDRLLAGIGRAVLITGGWYDCSGGILRQQRIGHERLLGADTTRHGTLLRLEAWYDVESPERSTEIQMSAGALRLEISLLLEEDHHPAGLRTVVVSSNLPAEYAEAVRRAVEAFNRSHRTSPLTFRRGGEILPLTTPLGITFDGVDERLATFVRRNPLNGEAEFLRLRLGITSWEREALREALRGEIPYRQLRRVLTDADLRRRTCMNAALTEALNDVFDPRAKEVTSSPRKDLGKEFRTTRRQIERWERFMQQESISAPANNTEASEDVLYGEMLDHTQQRYLHLVRKARGTALQGEVIEWIARGLIADGEGRFAHPTMRSNGEVLPPREAARRIRAVWKEVLAVASPRSLSGMGRLFRSTLEASGSEAFAMQDGFVSELLEALPGRPELAAEAETLEALYERIAGTADPETAIFARLQGQRLAARHETTTTNEIEP